MDIEQLKLIIGLVRDLAGDTKEVVGLLIAFELIKTCAWYGIVLWAVGKIAAVVVYLIAVVNKDDRSAAQDMRRSAGTLYGSDKINLEEYRQIEDIYNKVYVAGLDK